MKRTTASEDAVVLMIGFGRSNLVSASQRRKSEETNAE